MCGGKERRGDKERPNKTEKMFNKNYGYAM